MKCLNCKKPIVPDKEALNFITKEWDGHTLKFTCKCVPKKIRISKG